MIEFYAPHINLIGFNNNKLGYILHVFLKAWYKSWNLKLINCTENAGT